MVGVSETTQQHAEARPSVRPSHRPTHPGLPVRVAERVWRPVAILLLARVAAWIVLYLARPVTHASSPFHVREWDGGWYLKAAESGWPHHVAIKGSTLEFLPALPALIRVVHFVTAMSWTWSGLVAAFVAQIAMVIAVWNLTRDIWGEQAATRATILLCFAPGAFVFSLIYSEPLLIASAAACMLALRKRQWVLAGLAAAIGTATSPNDFPLIVCCAWEAFFAIRQRREWRSLWSVVLSAAGVGGWFSYLWASTGSALAWLTTSRRGWHEKLDLLAFLHLVQRVERSGSNDLNAVVAVAGTVVGAVLLVVLIRSRPPAVLIVFASVVLGLSFFSSPAGILPRFLMDAFPLLLALGYRVKGEVFGALVGVSAMLMSVLLVITVSTLVLVP